MSNPDIDLAAYIQANTTRTIGSDLIHGPVDDSEGSAVPDDCVFIEEITGPRPQDHLGNARLIKYLNVRVIVRGPRGVYRTPKTTAIDLYDLCHAATISGYIAVSAIGSGPGDMGRDSNNRQRFAMNFEMMIQT